MPTTIQIKEQVNTTNKVKYIIFPTTIKLKTLELKLDAMLGTTANKKSFIWNLSTSKKPTNINPTSRISPIYPRKTNIN